MLVNDGTSTYGTSFATAPVQIDSHDYYVEAEMAIVRWDECSNQLGIAVRSGAYTATLGRLGIGFPCPVGFAIRYNGSEILKDSEDVGGLAVYNVFRLEVKGTTLTFSVNGRVVATTLDNRALDPGVVGLVSVGAQVNVRLFRVVGE